MKKLYLNPKISEVCFLTSDVETARKRLSELYEIRDWQEASYTTSGKNGMRLYRHQPKEGLCFSLYEANGAAFSPCWQPGKQMLHHICHPEGDYKTACDIALQNGLFLLSEGVIKSGDEEKRSAFFFDGVLGSGIQLLEHNGARENAAPAGGNVLGKIGLAHIGYLTEDRERLLAHLEKMYGLSEWLRVEYKPQKAWCYGRPVKGQYYVKAAVIPNAVGCSWEINQAVCEGIHLDYLKTWPNRINHICHKIQDFEYWRDYFIGHGCAERFAAEMEDDIMGYRRCFYAYDTVLDVMFELMEKPHFRH